MTAPLADASRPAAAESDASAAAEHDASRRPPSGRVASRAAAAEPDASHPDPGEVSPAVLLDASRADSAVDALRLCAWCSKPIPPTARRDAVCCSVRCRQARHRFNRAAGMPAEASRAAGGARRPPPGPGGGARAPGPGGALRLAYADPPYPGKAWMYRGHPDYAGEVDHAALIRRLSTYDGWALSTSAAA